MALKDVWQLCESQSYPATASELAANSGDATISHPGGDASLADVLETAGETEFSNADEAAAAVYGALPAESVGRIGYSDRDPTPMGVDGGEQKSL
ncbi:DUF5789 family protein [Halocalculus aciditolerans]|uniref:DUF2795 domain-containing protein n=1 Tax=Halocalculus aciditolerans TaxID=1383812 RepID=A0A830FEV5_9EURY|nr:DUF5789 family protein [Halocalculus aciditolerans]GGL46513.1 hypothetical protein GCM10009039_01060 [Halocalculus aciditolerans]